MTLEETLVSVWRQALVEGAKAVELAGRRFPVGRTARRGLRQVDFDFEGQPLRGLEQNPETRSRWAQLARGGAKVMQFLELFGGHESAAADGSPPAKSAPLAVRRSRWRGTEHPTRAESRDLPARRYIAVVVNGKVTLYR